VITAHVERLADTLEELKPFFVPHYEELALDQDKVPLDPQYEVYLEREARGEVLLVTLRDRGKIVGYFVGFVAPALHYRTCLTLTEDIFWLHPDVRAEDSLSKMEEDMAAALLFETLRTAAKMRGVKRVFLGSKWHRSSAPVFEQMGLRKVEEYFSAWWGE
jgi:hypothetical protein